MNLPFILVLICLTSVSLASTLSGVCDSNEIMYHHEKSGKFFCCAENSCRLYKGEETVISARSTLEPTCTSESIQCKVEFSNNGGNPHDIYFVCGEKKDCFPITDNAYLDDNYCCRSQFCTFGSACDLESLSTKLSKTLFDVLLAVSIVLFVGSVVVNGVLMYKYCRGGSTSESKYITRDNVPGPNIFLPAQYEGGQGMTPGGEIINIEKQKTVKPRKTRRRKRQPTASEQQEEPMPAYPMVDPVATSYLEDHQTQDYVAAPLPEDISAYSGGVQYQQTEDIIGVPLGNISLNGAPGMEINDMEVNDIQPQEYAEDPNDMQVEDVNF